MIVVSTGCPSSVGPEVSISAAARVRGVPRVLVGDPETLRAAAELRGVPASRLALVDEPHHEGPLSRKIQLLAAGPQLTPAQRRPGRPSRIAGRAQLAYIERAFELCRSDPKRVLVTGPVSKEAVAGSGLPGAAEFRGHTEWLQRLDGANHSVMCFWAPVLVTSLATTHLPVADVPGRLSAPSVCNAVLALAELLIATGVIQPRIAVASLNPHAGEAELMGTEERAVIVPGLRTARRRLRGCATVLGPIGAETAYRKARGQKSFDGVVAMYHDQATIPMKLVAFGDAVNVTWGLSVVRTSVDHGTGYDIAWQGCAQESGMLAAMKLATRLAQGG